MLMYRSTKKKWRQMNILVVHRTLLQFFFCINFNANGKSMRFCSFRYILKCCIRHCGYFVRCLYYSTIFFISLCFCIYNLILRVFRLSWLLILPLFSFFRRFIVTDGGWTQFYFSVGQHTHILCDKQSGRMGHMKNTALIWKRWHTLQTKNTITI